MRRYIKPVFSRRNHFTFKGLLRITGIIFMHIICMMAFFIVIDSISYFQYNQPWIFDTLKAWYFLYLLVIGPFFTAIAHILYLDTGNLSLKAFVWLHTWLILILIVAVILI